MPTKWRAWLGRCWPMEAHIGRLSLRQLRKGAWRREGVGKYVRFVNCKGDEDIDAKRSRPSIGKPAMGHARKERVVLIGTDQRITSGPAVKRPRSKAGYMTAPERFAKSQILFPCTAGAVHT